METRKLYYEDPFQKGFATTVVSCDEVKGGYAVVLAETAFYPEGGGQPYDTGVLGEANVLEVHEKNGVITHLCDKPFEVGKSVSGKIDWARRFDHMQQHSGEHICSGLICERFHCDNVGFHMGADVVTIDFNADISWDELMEIEQLANLYIYEDHPIDIQFYRGAELDKVEYRSKKPLEGDVRIVSFPGADCCACCGTHVVRSGQVGLVKFLSVQKFRDGVRIELLSGKRAHRYLSECWAQDVRIAQALSVKPNASFAGVERVLAELSALKQRCAKLEESVFAQTAAQYEGKGDVLSHVNLHIRPGEMLALVGQSGGGKSTLCQLIPRFYEISSGSIALDGTDIRKIKLADLRSNIGIVQQDVFLFAGTILDNIRYGRPSATMEEVVEAAKMAEIHDDIMAMPDGYETIVGERGIMLSGGQKQRVSIARIFLKNPRVLILDEATSALDTATERKIQAAFDRLAKGRTTLVIAHRLSTIKNADEIVVVGEHGILEKGTHAQLVRQGGIYAELAAGASLSGETME